MHDPLQHCRSHCLSDISQSGFRQFCIACCEVGSTWGERFCLHQLRGAVPEFVSRPWSLSLRASEVLLGVMSLANLANLANLAIGCDLQFATAQVHCWRVTASVGTCAYHGISLTLRPVQACSHVVFCCKGLSWSTYDANPRSLGIARLKCHHFGPHHHLQLPFFVHSWGASPRPQRRKLNGWDENWVRPSNIVGDIGRYWVGVPRAWASGRDCLAADSITPSLLAEAPDRFQQPVLEDFSHCLSGRTNDSISHLLQP